ADLARKLDMEAHLASIGRISAGLAHELANPVAAATMSLGTLRSVREAFGGPGAAALDGALDDLRASLGRIPLLPGGWRPFVQGSPSAMEPVVLGDAVARVIRWAGEPLRGVAVERHVEPLEARAEPTMIDQLLLNLTTNAAYAARTLPSP